MAITEYARTKMPKAANRIINLSIEEISIGETDNIPAIKETIINQIEDCITTIATEGPGQSHSYNYLAGKLQEHSDRFIQEASRLSSRINDYEEPINLCDFLNSINIEQIREDRRGEIEGDIINQKEKTIIIKEKIGEHLRAIAQSIACLTGQKDGDKYEPRALKPRVQI